MEGGSAGGSGLSGMGGGRDLGGCVGRSRVAVGGWHSGVAVVRGVGMSQVAEAQVGGGSDLVATLSNAFCASVEMVL